MKTIIRIFCVMIFTQFAHADEGESKLSLLDHMVLNQISLKLESFHYETKKAQLVKEFEDLNQAFLRIQNNFQKIKHLYLKTDRDMVEAIIADYLTNSEPKLKAFFEEFIENYQNIASEKYKFNVAEGMARITSLEALVKLINKVDALREKTKDFETNEIISKSTQLQAILFKNSLATRLNNLLEQFKSPILVQEALTYTILTGLTTYLMLYYTTRAAGY